MLNVFQESCVSKVHSLKTTITCSSQASSHLPKTTMKDLLLRNLHLNIRPPERSQLFHTKRSNLRLHHFFLSISPFKLLLPQAKSEICFNAKVYLICYSAFFLVTWSCVPIVTIVHNRVLQVVCRAAPLLLSEIIHLHSQSRFPTLLHLYLNHFCAQTCPMDLIKEIVALKCFSL